MSHKHFISSSLHIWKLPDGSPLSPIWGKQEGLENIFLMNLGKVPPAVKIKTGTQQFEDYRTSGFFLVSKNHPKLQESTHG